MFLNKIIAKRQFFHENACRIGEKNLSLHKVIYKMKKIFIISLTLAMLFSPISVLAEYEYERENIEVSASGISLSINGGNVHIIGANGEMMEVFNLTGTRVASFRIDSNDKTFALNLPKGCYLVKVGKIVRKISVQ